MFSLPDPVLPTAVSWWPWVLCSVVVLGVLLLVMVFLVVLYCWKKCKKPPSGGGLDSGGGSDSGGGLDFKTKDESIEMTDSEVDQSSNETDGKAIHLFRLTHITCLCRSFSTNALSSPRQLTCCCKTK